MMAQGLKRLDLAHLLAITGLNRVPTAGDILIAMDSEKEWLKEKFAKNKRPEVMRRPKRSNS